MSARRFLGLLAGALLCIAGAMYLAAKRYLPPDPSGLAFVPELERLAANIDSVSLRKGSATAAVHLRRSAGQWVVEERDRYPASAAKLRKLILALSDARVVEEKTSNAAHYAILGVNDPQEPGSEGTEVVVKAAADTVSVVIGKTTGEKSYVRKTGESKSFLVSPAISVETTPAAWLDSRIMDLAESAIARVQISPATGQAYAIRRIKPDDANFAIESPPSGRKPLSDASMIGPSPTTFGGLDATDVAPAATVDFTHPATAVVTMKQGASYTLLGTVAGERHWLQIASSPDAAQAAKTAGRAYEIPSYRFDAIFKPLEKLLLPKP
jgi:hypothetical protein